MASRSSSNTRAGLIRLARVMLIVMTVGDVIGAACVFYLLGLAQQPDHLVLASVFTAVYVVVMGATTGWLYWLNLRRARRLPTIDSYLTG